MKVFHLIYTKVSPEESPWGKRGFHTLFYPIHFMTKADILELEKRIHFPGSGFDRKETIFYQKIQDREHLVILHIRSLPEARDTFGRGGIFLCHGFIFPPELWRRVSTPLALFDRVKGSLFTSCEEALSSSLVDRKTGDIQPLEILERDLGSLSTILSEPSTEFEWRMVILLNRIAGTMEESPPMLFKGEPERISALMGRLLAYIPDDLKVNLGWDPAFDGGNLTFYPLKIVGFKENGPTGGNPIRIDLETLTIEESPETSNLFLPNTPYEKWLYHCRKEAVSRERIEGAYKLSLVLESEALFPMEAVLPQRACFASVNREKIGEVFLRRCERIVGATIARHVAGILAPDSMLDLIVEDFPPAKLAKCVEDVILKNRLTPEVIKPPLPDSLMDAGSSRLRLVERVWKGEPLKPDDVKPLEREKRLELVGYLLLTAWAEKDWVIDILREDEDMLSHFLSFYETERVIEKILLRLISREGDFRGIAEFMAREVLRQDRGASLLRREIDLMEVLEGSLKKGQWDEKGMKRMISWAGERRAPERGFPYIRGFLYPTQGVPEEVLRDGTTKERLIECLIQHHGYKMKDFERLGFDQYELLKIEEHLKGKGWVERAKGFLRFRR